MLSRVADSIYWMSRYIERAENVARFIAVNLNLSLDLAGAADEQWLPLVITTGDQEKFAELYSTPTKQNVIRFLTFDRENPNSIMSSLRAARENARAVRESISSEMWEHINRFFLMVVEGGAQEAALASSYDFFDQIRFSGQQFMGVTDATMTHGEGWHFCRLGRSLERPKKTSRILDVKYLILLPVRPTWARRTTTSSGPPCSARPARWRCMASGTGAFSRPRSCSFWCSTANFRGPCCTA